MGEARRKRQYRAALKAAAELLEGLRPWPGKICGDCTACCSVVPVKEIPTVAWQRCPHVGEGCCTIYKDRPPSCRIWSCGWRIADWADDLRPDRCGFIVDPMEDLIWLNGNETPAIRIWVIPGHEAPWQEERGVAVIHAILHAHEPLKIAVLWDQPPSADSQGRRLGFTFVRDPDSGQVGMCAPQEVAKTAMGDGERMWRAHQMMQQAAPELP